MNNYNTDTSDTYEDRIEQLQAENKQLKRKNRRELKMKYFVLKPKGKNDYAFASRMAMLAYAANIKHTNPGLAKELELWVETENADKPVNI